MQKVYQIFLSSTFKDLEEERAVALQAIVEMGGIPSSMELFPASGNTQLDYIHKVIDNCDYYILIVAGKYGSLTDGGISFTEAEFDYALSKKKTILAFIHDSPNALSHDKCETDANLSQKLELFKAKVKGGRLVSFWNNSSGLKANITTSLHHAFESSPAIGWIRANEKSDAVQMNGLISEIHSVRFEQYQTQEELAKLSSGVVNAFFMMTKPATQSEIDLCKSNEQAAKHMYSFIGNDQIRFAYQDVFLPPMYGASAYILIVGKGVKVFRPLRGLGHNRIYYLDDDRCEGF